MPDSSSRRHFVRAVALGGSTAAVARADDPPKEEPRSEVDARMDLLLARYGANLDEAARKAVRSEVEAIVRRGESLRKFELTNGDEPMPSFLPYRAPLA